MANKRISELAARVPSTTDLMLVGDPTTGYSYKCTIAQAIGLANAVPYTGATQNVNLGEWGVSLGYLSFDLTPTGTPASQGTVYWDASKSTLALIMNGTTQHIGQDQFYYVKNSSGSNIPKGTAVRFAGTDGASGHILIAPMIANGSVPSQYYMGVTSEAIGNGGFGQVMAFGELDGINTSGYTAGDILYVSTTVAGAFQTTVPVAPNNIIIAAAAINSKNNGNLQVRATIGSNINNDEGVKITSPENNNLLVYNSTTGLWENKRRTDIDLVTGGGTIGYIPKYSISSYNLGISQIYDNATSVLINRTSDDGSGARFQVNGGASFSGQLRLGSTITNGTHTYTLPSATGTLALTSDLSGYLPLSGGTLTGALNGTSAVFSSSLTANGLVSTNASNPTLNLIGTNSTAVPEIYLKRNTSTTIGYIGAGVNSSVDNVGDFVILENRLSTGGIGLRTNGTTWFTISSTGAATFSSSVTAGDAITISMPAGNYPRFISTVGAKSWEIGYRSGTTNYEIREDGNTRLAISNGGNVGIGVTPSAWSIYPALQIARAGFMGAGNDNNISVNGYYDGSWRYIASAPAGLYNISGNVHSWYTAPSGTAGNAISFTQAMTLDASGRLGIGTTSPSIYATLSLNKNGTTEYSGVNITNANSTANFFVGVGGSSVSNTSLRNNAYVLNAANTDLILGTNDTERMRITSGGSLLVGTTTPNWVGNGFTLSSNGGTNKWLCGPYDSAPTQFYITAAAGAGVYLASTSATSWSSLSDERYKENLKPIEDAVLKLSKLRTFIGNYIDDETKTKHPFLIAQDVLQILPEAVDTSNTNKYGLSYTDIIPLLVKAIQELKAELNTIKA